MNVVLSAFERILIGPDPDPADERVMDFRNGEVLSRRDLTESVLVMASVNKGKTTLLRTPARAMLRDGFGGLVLVVKGSLVDNFTEFARAEGRESDLVVLRPGGGHGFNPLENETDPAEAAALLAELSDALAEKRRDGMNESFWREQLAIILRNVLTICQAAHGRMDLLLAAELFDGRATSLSEVVDPVWRESSALARAMAAVRNAEDPQVADAVLYFSKTFPTLGDRLQGSLVATVSTVFDHLRRPPLRGLFTGKSTFSMDDLLEQSKVCIVALPVLDSAAGRVANALMQFCFCWEAVRRPREHYSFLIADECQEFVTRELMGKLAVLREFKVASILLTQNLAVLDERIGESAREGLCGLLGTKIFGPQGHAATRQWAAEQIGKRKISVQTKTNGRSRGEKSSSVSESEQWDYRVPPIRFAELGVGQTIVLRDGRVWRARWHLNKPGRRGTVKIVP
jgi:type IV secretory pathway TraG/TraD family ATPase VirD4